MDRVPRRLRRFYRPVEKKYGDGGHRQGSGRDENDYYGIDADYKDVSSYTSPERQQLGSIPTMNYEDLEIDPKNYRELKKFEQKKKEEELALLEINRFKETHNRLPSKEEAEQIAENIYSQLKESDVSELYPASEEENGGESNEAGGRKGWRERRLRKDRQKRDSKEAEGEEMKIPMALQTPQSAEPIKNIKALLEDESFDLKEKGGPKKGGKKSVEEFDLDEDFGEESDELDLGEAEEAVSIEKLDKKGSSCPNCKAKTEKIIYCPKCGKAYCSKCAASCAEGKYSCPDCGTKTKI